MGQLIVIDGLDGSGKHTQLLRLSEYLQRAGRKVRTLSFPHYHTPGCVLVEEYLAGRFGDKPGDTNAYTASLFYAMDRYYSFKTDWEADWRDPDTILLSDRYTTANAVHQAAKLPRDAWDDFLTWLFDTEYGKIGLPAPDRVIYLEVPPALSLALVDKRSLTESRRKDIHEKDAAFLFAGYDAARYAAARYGWTQIHCAEDESVKGAGGEDTGTEAAGTEAAGGEDTGTEAAGDRNTGTESAGGEKSRLKMRSVEAIFADIINALGLI